MEIYIYECDVNWGLGWTMTPFSHPSPSQVYAMKYKNVWQQFFITEKMIEK